MLSCHLANIWFLFRQTFLHNLVSWLSDSVSLTNWRLVAPLECLICNVWRICAFFAVESVGTSHHHHHNHLYPHPHPHHRHRLSRFFELPFECRGACQSANKAPSVQVTPIFQNFPESAISLPRWMQMHFCRKASNPFSSNRLKDTFYTKWKINIKHEKYWKL